MSFWSEQAGPTTRRWSQHMGPLSLSQTMRNLGSGPRDCLSRAVMTTAVNDDQTRVRRRVISHYIVLHALKLRYGDGVSLLRGRAAEVRPIEVIFLMMHCSRKSLRIIQMLQTKFLIYVSSKCSNSNIWFALLLCTRNESGKWKIRSMIGLHVTWARQCFKSIIWKRTNVSTHF